MARRPNGAGSRLVPAGAVLAVLLLIGAGAWVIHRAQRNTSPSAVGTIPTEAIVTSTPTPSRLSLPALSDSAAGTAASSVRPASGDHPALLSGFHVADLSWVSDDQGFALSQPNNCRVLPGQSCFVLARTTDGGVTWAPVTKTEAEVVPGVVSHLRFADTKIGYIWGDHLFRTDDGGATWVQQPDSSYQLSYGAPNEYEISLGTVLRLTYGGGQFYLESAKVGTNDWTPVFGTNAGTDFPQPPKVEAGRRGGEGATYFQELDRVGKAAVILEHRNPAGGANIAYSELFVSTDNGVHWRNLGEPCPQLTYREVDSTSMSMADDGSIVVLCRPRTEDPAPFVAISTDGGLSFRAAPQSLGSGTRAIVAVSATTILAWSDALYRSTDSGRTWHRVLQDSTILGSAAPTERPLFLGFESALVGRYVSQDGATIYTTRDAGATWTAFSFS